MNAIFMRLVQINMLQVLLPARPPHAKTAGLKRVLRFADVLLQGEASEMR